jgi:hypothetical protein
VIHRKLQNVVYMKKKSMLKKGGMGTIWSCPQVPVRGIRSFKLLIAMDGTRLRSNLFLLLLTIMKMQSSSGQPSIWLQGNVQNLMNVPILRLQLDVDFFVANQQSAKSNQPTFPAGACFECHLPGHFSKQCPYKFRQYAPRKAPSASFCSTRQPPKQSVNQEKMKLSTSYYILLNIQKNMS